MPTDEGLEAVKKLKIPQSNILPRSFLGLVSFSMKFTRQFSTVTAPLHVLIRNNASFLWVKKYVEFINFLECLISGPSGFGIYQSSAPTVITADARSIDLASVLMQLQKNSPKIIYYLPYQTEVSEKEAGLCISENM
jgi:hypothetical protein